VEASLQLIQQSRTASERNIERLARLTAFPTPANRKAFVAGVLGLALIYVMAARFGLSIGAVSGFATLVWPATGIAFVALLRGGLHYWPGIAVGAFAVNLWTGVSPLAALGIAAGNTLEATIAVFLVRRALHDEFSLGRLRDAFALILLAAGVSTTLSATIGTASLFFSGIVQGNALGETWFAWWLGDAIGDLVVAPLLLLSWPDLARYRSRAVEALGLAVAWACVGALVFGPWRLPVTGDFHQVYLLFPVLVWAAMSFPHGGASLATFGFSAIAIAGTALGYGPFVGGVLSERLAALQAFMLVLAGTGLLLAASKAQMDAAEERASAARELAEHASRAKDEFLALLGHELRNPLAPIVTALELLKLRGVLIPSTERSILERQVRHLIALVDDLLDVSRIARGKIELQQQPVEIDEVLSRAVEMAKPLIDERHHELVLSVPVHGLRVNGDAMRLAQVFANLLTNTARYSAPNGYIAIAAERVGETLTVHVRDRGQGIASNVMPHIFEAFTQGPRLTAQGRVGLGIGLALVRSIVELHGGSVTAASDGPGHGSTFSVQLPATDDLLHQEDSAQLPMSKTRPKRRVLIVDDNADAAELLATLLRGAEHTVSIALDPGEAFRLASKETPEIAILDIDLPMMDGYALAEHLRSVLGNACPRLIAITGYGQPEDRARSASAAFEHHFVKPVAADALLAVL